ncbi:hypothetical protein [Streptomyces alkaliterrae]|uniref:Uncharacterized protein n=1 Tax=Streptomyces alkaliterrae TaxID=2213162 RepID=A0A7W3WL65_9ACTN|nr:hypothetical protein [Streptomyces alkaliterrae]MBB1254374.1 hypothetical protein [Streptomyces alkaliterrae]MBB1258684.1 hypothetical protein [Streptomyces alkaliterrae]
MSTATFGIGGTGMSWGRRAAAVVAAALLGGTMTAGTAGAAAPKEVCGWTSTPAGWIEIRYWDSTQCGPLGGGMYNMKRIADTSGVAPGRTVAACTYSPKPAGFRVTRYTSISDCNRSRGTSDYHNQVDLVNLTGLAKGATRQICGLFDVPAGWTVVSRSRSVDCQQYKYGYPSNDNTMTIRKS